MAQPEPGDAGTTDGGAWLRWSLVVLVAGLAVTAAGVAATWRLSSDSREQLLGQQTREAAAVLTVAIGRAETSLSDAAVLADATGGDAGRFALFADSMSTNVGLVGAQLVADDGSVVSGEAPSR